MKDNKEHKRRFQPKMSLLTFWNFSSPVTFENNKHVSSKYIHKRTAIEKVQLLKIICFYDIAYLHYKKTKTLTESNSQIVCYSFYIAGGSGQLVVNPYSGLSNQKWAVKGKAIMLHDSQFCIDICGADKSDSAKVIGYQFGSATNQHWRLETA